MSDREYQSRTYEAIRRAIGAGHKRILVVLPTGGGKGRMAARIMDMTAAKGNSSIFFAQQRELITQIASHFVREDVPYRTIMAGVQDEYECFEDHARSELNTLVAKDTLWARSFRRDKLELPAAGVVHVDECHQSLSRTYQAILGKYSESVVIGWTATPCRTDNKPLGEFYQTMIQAATYKELQALEFLVPVKVIAPTRPDLKGCHVSRGDYAKGDLEKRMNRDQMVGSIVNEWRKHSEGRSTVLFAAGIQHSIHCRDMFRNIGVTAEHIDGEMPNAERDEIMERVRDGKVKVLCNYGVATTGVDIPSLKYMICARPTKSFGLWRQMGGRIQRPYGGHDHCMIQDHSDNAMVLGHPDEDVEWEIHGDDDISKKHAEKKRKEAEAKNEPKEPFRCEKCFTVYRGYRCPNCGHKPESKGEAIKMTKGELVELERKKLNSKATPREKQKHWDECLGWAIGSGKNVGAAAHRYKATYGVFPNHSIQEVPRASQWKMSARDFYAQVIKPGRQAAQQMAEADYQPVLFMEKP